MDELLRILHLEDDPVFPALVSTILEKEGIRAQISSVADYPEFIAALEKNSYDIVIADYLLPSCNGLQALQVTRQKCPDTPFVLISGTIGDQVGIESLRCGATDYVMKDSMERLVPAVRRAVQESRDRARRKQMETDLARREKYFRALTENSLDVLTVLTPDGVFQYNSPSLKTILGYDPIELAGRNAFDLIHPEDLSLAYVMFEGMLKHPALKVTQSLRFRHGDGSWCRIEAVGQNRLENVEVSGIVLNMRDAGNRKPVRAGTQESGRQFRELFEGSPDAVLVVGLNGKFLDVNPAACRLWRASPEKLTRRDMAALASRQREQEVMPKLAMLLAGRVNQLETVIVTEDGCEIPVEVSGNGIAYGSEQAVLIHVRDMSERKRAAEALKQSEASLVAAQRIAHLGSWELDLAKVDTAGLQEFRWSDETYKIFGVEPQRVALTSEALFEFIHPEDRQKVKDAMRLAFERKEPYDIEHRIVRPDGEERVVRQRAELAFDELGRPVQMRGIVVDVTDRKRLEEQLRQSQKMEAIGQLAGGVAHDFNNLLTVIHGHAALLLRDDDISEFAGRSARQIAQAVERAAGLTRQLLAFSRRQVMQPRHVDLNGVVSNMTRMLGRILGEDVALQLDFSTEPAFIHADISMIEQVLLNLAVNARDAMPKGGKLAVKITIIKMTASHQAVHPESRAGDFVCLSVVDNGCGIAPANLPHIFEPFFTTKEVGKGTGLGLATVYGVVEQHQGWIEVKSDLGGGTTFDVYLPKSKQAGHASDNKPKDQIVRGGQETVFVVEDEMPVRELVCAILRNHGYNVLQAESGTKAVEWWPQIRDSVDLLLTDLVMPDRINGRELAEILRNNKPSLKVIFTSGYSADVVGKDFFSQPGLFYLQKPYEPQKLALMVRGCLDAKV
jgi:two-component system cell cycle sensor histidine kinase/response regulator CckA